MLVSCFQMKEIIWLAVISRCFVLLVQFISNSLLPDHHSTDAFQSVESNQTLSFGDYIILKLISGLKRWDAQHFIHIAENGYTFENNLAFFPVFPVVIREFKRIVFFVFTFFLSDASLFLLASVLLNLIFFVLSAVTLYNLTKVVLMNRVLAYYSTILFCINPASIFFSAPYSESFFTLCTFFGLLLLELNFSPFLASIVFAFASGIRANGIINAGFILFKILLNYLRAKNKSFFFALIQIVLCVSIITLPFIIYQLYAYYLFCNNSQVLLSSEIKLKALKENYILPGSNPPWCQSVFPISYSYIQNKYWNVGFMKYYELKQIPNFLLASPVLFFSLSNSIKFIINHKTNLLTLNFFTKLSSYSLRLLPYVAHITFLSLFCLLCAHVQISTRMLASASPILYWYSSSVLVNNSKVKKIKTQILNLDTSLSSISNALLLSELELINYKSVFIKYYFLSYCIIGTILFSNNLPWT